MTIKAPLLFCFSFGIASLSLSTGADFNRDVRPILSDKCFACHGFDEKERKADLRLDTKEGAFADLGGYAALVPGDLKNSEVWLRITTDDRDDLMPPPRFHKPLTGKEKELIREWIEEGAEYKTHWSYAPLQRKDYPEGPALIDAIIEAGLKKNGLPFSPRADPVTLTRRLHFDLLGLPPGPEVVDRMTAAGPDHSAYEKLVDELLASPAFGERLAVYWLDLVRFADTIGYHSDNYMEVSAYRDYVINAFNRNLPYDQFATEQIAGDLLPGSTIEQKVASGYNRLLQTTEEGGAQAEEYKVIYAADRVRNFSGVWLGSTMGCAQCHDHKYDPFSMRDFYSMAAFFADVKEKPNGRRQPNLKLPNPDEKKRIAELKKRLPETKVENVLKRDAALRQKVEAAQLEWEKKTLAMLSGSEGAEKMWKVAKFDKLASSGGQKFAILDDGSALASGRNPPSDDYSAEITGTGRVTAFRLEAFRHDTLTRKSLARGNGNFVLSEVRIKHGDKAVPMARAFADYEQSSWPISAALDNKNQTGWAVDGHTDKTGDRAAVFVFQSPVDLGAKGTLKVELIHRSAHPQHHIGRFRLSLTDSLSPSLPGRSGLPAEIESILTKSPPARSAGEQAKLKNHYQTISPLLTATIREHDKVKEELAKIEKDVQTMLVSESLDKPRMTRILNRGDWLDKTGEVVEPALPAFLPRDAELPENRRGTRLDLARWVTGDSNPLTSRAFVNRVWMLFFGEGISRDVDDLGGQGTPPTHPELLNQLAIRFREGGWDVKALIKDIVMSRTYQQVSTETPELAEKDPGNQLWSRQGRWRIEAEFVRDTALRLSGLLVDAVGGKSVKPYQPAGFWQHLNFPKRSWQPGNGDDLYRRGVYTFRCRSFPHPALVSFDAGSREECASRRSRSNIPQQALVLLNDPQFVEAARAFGERIAREKGDLKTKIRFAWKTAVSRDPSEEEIAVIVELYQNQLKKYNKEAALAGDFLAVGESKRDEKIPPAEAAAWTQTARAILNAYEVISRN